MFSNNSKNKYAFIDSQNLMQSLREQGWKINHKKFIQFLREKYNVDKVFYFVGFIKENRHLYDSLKAAGYTIIFKNAIRNADGTMKANVDVELAVQVMIEINNYDKAIIVSGDGDFAYLINYLNQHNKLENVIVPNSQKYSGLINDVAKNRLVYLDYHKNEVGDGISNNRGCNPFSWLFNLIKN